MSYDIALVAGFVPPDVDLAWDAIGSILRAEGPVHPLIAAYRAEIEGCGLDWAMRDEGGSSDGDGPSILLTFGVRHVMVSIMTEDADAIVSTLVAQGLRAGLVAFDAETRQIHTPGGFAGVTLTIEDRPCRVGPRLHEVLDAIPMLTPAGGPSFMVLSRGGNDYAQIAGGDGHFAFEWRESVDDGFRHWAAGYPDEDIKGIISVMTNGFHVPVRSNENLNASDVAVLFEAFLTGCGRPEAFRWRDMTGEFT